MKVSKAGSSKQVASTKKKMAAANTGEFAERVRGVAGVHAAEDAHGVEGVAKVGAVDAVFAIQEVPDSTEGRSKGLVFKYGDELLDRLDEFRLAILAGVISKERLTELAQMLRQKKKETNDPRLNEIIEEIELRAEVEVAKLTRKL
jgi:hypothetical protein